LERACTILAFALLIVSAVALWQGKTDAAFVLGTLGAVAWFVGFRFRLKQTHSEAQATEGSNDDSDDGYED
jgi:hypothetical protein